MLRRWSVENFKSVKGRVELTLAPLTILAGSNSSGKSTVLHSILLAKQTLRYSPSQRPIALNGPILKLGFFDDVKHSGTTDSHIGLGFEFDFTIQPRVKLPSSGSNFINANFRKISLESKFQIRGSTDIDRLQPLLQYGSLSAEFEQTSVDFEEIEGAEIGSIVEAEVMTRLSCKIDNPKPIFGSEDGASENERSTGIESRILFNVAELDAQSTEELYDDLAKARIVGAKAKHFLPNEIVIEYDQNATRAVQLTERLFSLGPAYRSARFEQPGDRIPKEVLDVITTFLEEHGFSRSGQLPLFSSDDQERVIHIGEAAKYLRESFQLKSQARNPEGSVARASPHLRIRAALQDLDLKQDVIHRISARLGSRVVRTSSQTDEQAAIVGYIEDFIGTKTRYIGPLRDEPKPLYPLEEVSDPTDVGYRGEHTAAVLELNRYRWITYIPPISAEDGFSNVSLESESLVAATVRWLDYLGVATAVQTSDMGKFGHGMRVKTDFGSGEHDLTNVGVGVSQVLPIVVMALLAPSESLLIFEQPELHLHPRVQSRLADFFVSLSLVGKQCILETHSEYLIQRLRRRIAESSGDTLRDDIQVYFVERSNGASNYKPIKFSEFGAIADWPPDFFDQSDKEVEKLLQAASKKRAARQKSKKF